MDVDQIRRDFPILQKSFPNGPLVYFDNACTTLRPRPVIEAVREYYEEFPVCGDRSLHRLGREVTLRVDASRQRVAQFFRAAQPEDVVFTKNATEALNLVAFGLPWKRGDVVVTTDKEHSSNWLPWLRLAETHGVRHLIVPSHPDGRFDWSAFEATLRQAGDRLRLVSVVHASNIDGVVTPVREIARAAHEQGARVLVDAAQSAPHHRVDVRALEVDYLAASTHKMLGPGGLGVLVGRREALEALQPVLLGGGTVKRSTATTYDWQDLPQRFEAGLQNFPAIVAFPAALDYLDRVGLEEIETHERALNEYASRRLQEIKGVTVYGPAARERSGILPFAVAPFDAHDVAVYLDEARNVAVRSGAMCVYSYFAARQLTGWARASFYLYNTTSEIDAFVEAVDLLARGTKQRKETTVPTT